jgi:hypothetical protein
MHHKKAFAKIESKKNGPLTWDALNEDLIEGFSTVGPQQHQKSIGRRTSHSNFIQTKSKSNYSTNSMSQASSENQNSPTFRPVGPHLDSTVNVQGQKYSNIMKNLPNRRISPGYYGRSRLTRI